MPKRRSLQRPVKAALNVFLLVGSEACLAQKWIDDEGRIYYGAPPAGVYVRPAPMGRGTSSSVGAQEGSMGERRESHPGANSSQQEQRTEEEFRRETTEMQWQRKKDHAETAAQQEDAAERQRAIEERRAAVRERQAYERELREELREKDAPRRPR